MDGGGVLSVSCPACAAPPGRPCLTGARDPCKAHHQRRDAQKKRAKAPPRRKSGNKGHRLQYTKVSSPEINGRANAVRRAKPVKVTHADGRTEVRAPGSFGKSRKSPMWAAQLSVERDRARARYIDAAKADRPGCQPESLDSPKTSPSGEATD